MPVPHWRGAISAYYGASVAEFLATTPEAVIGALAMADSYRALDVEQRRAWEEEVNLLRGVLAGLDGMLFLEFDVPRLGSRVDAVLVSGPAVFPIEFKCGETRFTTDAYNQAWDYGLDLKNFHRASHAAPIFPILVATGATEPDSAWQPAHDDGVRPPRRSTAGALRSTIHDALAQVLGQPLVDGAWHYHSFRGDEWTNVKAADRRRYLLNAYRVLLTRARQGMAIFVPPGDHRDPTRLPEFYDGTFEYLRDLGLPLA